MFFGTHKSKAQLAVCFLRDDNSAIFQMSRCTYPELVFVDFEQTSVRGKIISQGLGHRLLRNKATRIEKNNPLYSVALGLQ